MPRIPPLVLRIREILADGDDPGTFRQRICKLVEPPEFGPAEVEPPERPLQVPPLAAGGAADPTEPPPAAELSASPFVAGDRATIPAGEGSQEVVFIGLGRDENLGLTVPYAIVRLANGDEVASELAALSPAE